MKGLKTVAELMAIAARTAPKSRGEDFIEIKIIEGEDIKRLAEGMMKFSEQRKKPTIGRDGNNVKASEIIVLIGLKDDKPVNLNCGVCGYNSCSELENVTKTDGEFRGPHCAFRLLDLGIALGSAVKTAGILNTDSRVMYSIGTVARHIGLCEWDYVIGIPLSATGKSIYFDRK
jgi:uncharacterized ferredoxin-like protein